MRQFDVFVFDENFDETRGSHPQPPFTDQELGWFFTNEWNKHLDEIEGEWVVFAQSCIKIDRDFLNNVADVTDSFPMVDAFAPRVRTIDKKFWGGYILRSPIKGSGFIEIDENAPMRYVAAPRNEIAIFSRRIIQRTGGFDMTLPSSARLADYTLRMMHAGGKMFSVPYLVAQVDNSLFENAMSKQQGRMREPQPRITQDIKSAAIILSKAFGIEASLPFALHHPSVIPTLLRNRKERKEKRKAATLLSKFTKEFLAEITE